MKGKMKIVFSSIKVRAEIKKQLQYAEEHNDKSLINCLRRFRNWTYLGDNHQIRISKDWAERSFFFSEEKGEKIGICGGIIYHGYPEEGYKTNLSIQLTPNYGWSIHT